MITFVLTREYFNNDGTYGELREGTTGFRCKTIEKIPPKEGDTPFQQSTKALPCGTYDLRSIYLPMEDRYTFQLMKLGTFARACFQKEKITHAGDILLAKTHSPGQYAAESHVVLKVIDRFIMEKMATGELPTKGKRGFVQLVIKNSDSYGWQANPIVFEKEEEEDKTNWDLVDDHWW